MDKVLLEKLVNEHYSEKQIAKLTGRGAGTVHRWLCKYDLHTHHHRFGAGDKKPCLCEACGEKDPERFFGHKKSLCKTCFGKHQHSRWRKYKRILVAYKGGKCVKCGYDRCSAALDFHHTDPDHKDPNWKKMRCWSLERVKPELDKCILVCKCCHAEIHYGLDDIENSDLTSTKSSV